MGPMGRMGLLGRISVRLAAAFEAGYTFVVLASDVFILWKWSERMRTLSAGRPRMRVRQPRGRHVHVP